MPVIALVGNKGGAGKTTLCINLASAIHRRKTTVLLDADPQRSSSQWRDIAGLDDLVEVIDAVDDVAGTVRRVRDRYDYVMIDCPPSVHSAQTWQALSVCDIALVPVLPSPLDLWASVHVEQEVELARAENPAIRAMLVINQIEPRTRLSQIASQALAEIDIDVAETAVRRRVVYRNAILRGRSVLESGAAGRAAAEEINQLANEVVNLS